jgi:hypothetical protein
MMLSHHRINWISRVGGASQRIADFGADGRG